MINAGCNNCMFHPVRARELVLFSFNPFTPVFVHPSLFPSVRCLYSSFFSFFSHREVILSFAVMSHPPFRNLLPLYWFTFPLPHRISSGGILFLACFPFLFRPASPFSADLCTFLSWILLPFDFLLYPPPRVRLQIPHSRLSFSNPLFGDGTLLLTSRQVLFTMSPGHFPTGPLFLFCKRHLPGITLDLTVGLALVNFFCARLFCPSGLSRVPLVLAANFGVKDFGVLPSPRPEHLFFLEKAAPSPSVTSPVGCQVPWSRPLALFLVRLCCSPSLMKPSRERFTHFLALPG